jgi:hypothetical protein
MCTFVEALDAVLTSGPRADILRHLHDFQGLGLRRTPVVDSILGYPVRSVCIALGEEYWCFGILTLRDPLLLGSIDWQCNVIHHFYNEG